MVLQTKAHSEPVPQYEEMFWTDEYKAHQIPAMEHAKFDESGKLYMRRTFWVRVEWEDRPKMTVYVKQRPGGICLHHPMGSIDGPMIIDHMPPRASISVCPEKMNLVAVENKVFPVFGMQTFVSNADAVAALRDLTRR